MALHRIELIVDDDDYRDINAEIAEQQRLNAKAGCGLPDGEGNLAGRYIGEMVRNLQEYRAAWEAEHPK